MIMRMLGAARLNVHTYEEVEGDSSATTQALIIVVLVSIASGVGGLLSGETDVVRGLVYGVVTGVVSWAVWALVTMFVGTKLLKTEATEADWGQLARTTGFAQTPGLLNVLGFISGVGGFILLLTFVWRLVAMVIAVRQALDYTSTLRTVFVVLISFIPAAIINGLIVWALPL